MAIYQIDPGFSAAPLRALGLPMFPPNLQHPAAVAQANGLVFWYADPIASRDLTGRLPGRLPWVNGAGPVGTLDGVALNCNANDRGAQLTTTQYNSLLPVSLVVSGWKIGTPTTYSSFFGLTYTSSNASPYVQFSLAVSDPAGDARMDWNNVGTYVPLAVSGGWSALASGSYFCLVGTLTSGQEILYRNGFSIGSASSAITSISAGANPLLSIGGKFALARNPAIHVLDARIYNRVLTPTEVYDLWHPTTRWALYTPDVSPILLSIGVGADPEGSLLHGKLIRGGLLCGGVLR